MSSPGVNVSGEPPPGILIFAQSWKKLNSTFGKMKKGMKGEKETTPAEQVLMSYEKNIRKLKHRAQVVSIDCDMNVFQLTVEFVDK